MPEEDPRIIELREMRAKARMAGGEERIAKHKAKGKLTARERCEALLDAGTFNELEPYVTHRCEDLGMTEKYPGDGVVIGYGSIDGRAIYVYAQDFTVMGGSLGEMQGKKIAHIIDMAAAAGAPVIGLIDSGGARINEGVRSLYGYAQIFQRNAWYSGVIPQISVVLGPCAGGAAYSPAVTDMIIMVEKQSFMFLTGPEVIKSVTGEVVDSESLGGADVHLGVSGTAHLKAQSDKDAIALARKVLGYLPSNNVENPPFMDSGDDPNRMDESLNSLVPIDPYEPYHMHEAIEKIVDLGTFVELQATFARNAIVGLARMGGYPVGIVAQEPAFMAGSMDIDSADKIARFVRFCDAFNIPLVTFCDSPGFLPGVDQEHRGVIRHGAKVLFSYSNATVPKIQIITRKAYGGAYIVMSSKVMGADISFAWPSAEIAVMGPEGAANILYRKQIQEAEDPAAERKKIVEEYRKKFLNPYAAAADGYVDDVIEPRETRMRVIAALAALREKTTSTPARKHGNIPL
ncbi:MAG: carboxyl transferase domain-containing protein [Chloroflexota bacterium]|jgi:propionyl-CoA carboxylase beta chain